MNLELINKTALISGSTKGIGFSIASQLAAEGARIIVNGRSGAAVDAALEQIRKDVPQAKSESFHRVETLSRIVTNMSRNSISWDLSNCAMSRNDYSIVSQEATRLPIF